ncbi:RsmD family RNA methyltransferase [Oceanithermus profundus]
MARLRILGGKARGRTLAVPDSARPSPVRLRKALFDYLRGRLPRRGRFLDLYAGSGAVGLEAASEGFEAVLVESNPGAVKTLRENAHKLGLSVRVVPESADRFLERSARAGERFDVVFLDPPYDQDLAAALARVLEAGIVGPGGFVILQHPSDLILPLGERRVYGSSALTIVEVT